MPNAKRPLRAASTPLLDDGSGYRRRPSCALCGERIRCTTCIMVNMPGDPDDLVRPAHPKCGREYILFLRALGV